MGVDLKRWFGLGLGIAELLVPAIGQVEQLARSIPALRGKQKQDAVVDLVRQSLEAAEALTEKDLLSNADVERATRGVVDAVVALSNIIAAKRQGQK